MWVILSWVIFPLGPLSLAMAITLPLALCHAIRARSGAAVALVLANPLSFFFLQGVMDYAGGTPALRGMGLPGPEYANIDPATRCRRISGGCVIRGHEWASILPHNLALRTMVFLFGPPAGTYDGPYPTREEAMAAVSATGTLVSVQQFAAGTIPTAAGEVRMEHQVLEKISTHLFAFSGYGMGKEIEGEQLHAALWHGRCLIMRWRGSPDLAAEDGIPEVMVCVDARSGKPFAVHDIGKNSHLRRAAIAIFWR